MRGAPQSGFSRLICRISFRISRDTGGRPGRPRWTFHVQNRRNPLRCQAITVSGFTMQCRAPRGPCSTKPGPQYAVEPVQFRLLHGALQHAKLMPKREDLKLQCRSSLENRLQRPKECHNTAVGEN
jgi:hypothetical protein